MRNRLTPWVFGAALAAIPLLGYVQYRWVERVSDAELQREATRLQQGLEQVAGALDAEVARAHLWFALRPAEVESAGGRPTADSVAAAYSARVNEWRSGAEFPGLVREVLFEFDSEFRKVRASDGSIEEVSAIPQTQRSSGPVGRNLPFVTSSGDIVLLMPVLRNGPPGWRGGPPGQGGGFGFGRGRGGPERPPRRRGPDGPPPSREAPPPPRDREDDDEDGIERHRERALILDREHIVRKVIPRLADRYLGSRSPELRVADGDRILAGEGVQSVAARVRTLAMRPECLLAADQLDLQGGPPEGRRSGPVRANLLRLTPQNCPALPANGPAGLWELGMANPVAASAGAFRTRNLAISFGVLACLAGAILALWVSTRRAAELARRQMEFAMAVSHELRTPLTVMRLAGDNLAQGIATTPEQVRRYGETIRRESERLAGMVEQLLTFARAQRPDFVVRAQPVPAAAIVDGALSAAETVLRDAGFTVVREVEPDLPQVHADLNLMIAALTNLVVNAVRHASAGKWVRVRATAASGRVEIEVADHGPGIGRRDLRRVFRPFYRGTLSGGSQGTGLGLHLVRKIAEAHGGTVEVESSPGAGTVATIGLPVAIPPTEEANV
ncbi:MAG: HAMP domain-containing sensor histidine kinase [Bryobacteraceae bacterium]|nr:HAMP domain-containing sensor histidine kinase [Bryobacteraceae bacterium]